MGAAVLLLQCLLPTCLSHSSPYICVFILVSVCLEWAGRGAVCCLVEPWRGRRAGGGQTGGWMDVTASTCLFLSLLSILSFSMNK